MSNANQETIADIVAEMRNEGHAGDESCLEWVGAKIRGYADRREAAERRRADSIHRAMVIIAGIEMEDSENPPRLWTALEDAYDALSDALGTDGETTADMEEANATGRSFVVKPYGNSAKIRESLSDACYAMFNFLKTQNGGYEEMAKALDKAKAALAATPRNCDIGTALEQVSRHRIWCKCGGACAVSCKMCFAKWSQMPYDEGGATNEDT